MTTTRITGLHGKEFPTGDGIVSPISSAPSAKARRAEVKAGNRPLTKWEAVKVGTTVGLLGVIAVAGVVAGVKKVSEREQLPQPIETGVTVKIYPQEHEGENHLINKLSRDGVDSNKFRETVEATETTENVLDRGPIEVDSGFLTTDEDVLAQYGVQPQELHPKK